MFELILMGALCVMMGRVAGADNGSPWIWVLLTAVLCTASLLIPLPFLRIGIAGIIVFISMMVVNMIRR